jgi:hypothetical protein
LFGAIETDLPGVSGWIDRLRADDAYDESVAIDSGTMLLRPGSRLALEALWRLWNVDFYTPSSLEEYRTWVQVTFSVEAPAACAVAAGMGGSDELRRALWNALLNGVRGLSLSGAAAMTLSREVDAMMVAIDGDGALQVRLRHLQSFELIEALLALFDRLQRREPIEWSNWQEDIGTSSGCRPTDAKMGSWKQFYVYHYTWPAEQDRMQDLAKKRPNLLRPIRLQYNPFFFDEAFLSTQSKPYLVWHASATVDAKASAIQDSKASAIQDAKAALRLIKTNGNALFGIGIVSEAELDTLMHTWYSNLNATDVRDLDCCMERVGWHTVGEHSCANIPAPPPTPAPAQAPVSAPPLLAPAPVGGPARGIIVAPPAGPPDRPLVPKCADTPAWDNGKGLNCAHYVQLSYCRGGLVLQNWTVGASFNFPERHCCLCGKSH